MILGRLLKDTVCKRIVNLIISIFMIIILKLEKILSTKGAFVLQAIRRPSR